MDIDLPLRIIEVDKAQMLTELTVTVERTHSVGALLDALIGFVGLDPAHPWYLGFGDGREALADESSVGDVGLISGRWLVIAPELSWWPVEVSTGRRPSGGRDARLELVVRSGPDVGAWTALRRDSTDRARLSVGRDPSCSLLLSDPTVARVGVEIDVQDSAQVQVRVGDYQGRVLIDGVVVNEQAPLAEGQLLRVGASTLALRPGRSADLGSEAADGAGRRPAVAARSRRDLTAKAVRSTAGLFGEIPFHRTPYYPIPIPEVTFDPLGDVPELGEPNRFAYLAALMPLVMGITMALLYSPRFLMFAVLSPIMAVANHIDQRRRRRRRYGKALVRFEARVAERKKRLVEALATERRCRFEGAADLVRLAERARTKAPEVWIRDRGASDALTLRLGLGDATPRLVVSPETRGDEALRDELAAEVASMVTMGDVPVVVDLRDHGVLALVGQGVDTMALAASLLVQACCLHSPEDVVVVVAAAGGRASIDWVRWLPHLRSASSPLEGPHLVWTREGVDQMVKELLVVAEHRLDGTDRSGSNLWPRLIMVIDRDLDPDPSLVSRLLDLGPNAGVTLIWLTTGAERVPRQASAVVECRGLLDPKSSTVSYTDPDTTDTQIEIERLSPHQAVALARSLAPLRDASSATSASAVPRLVTLHQALGTNEVDADWILDQWSGSGPGANGGLLAPVGMTANGRLLVDLDEHGPHGLIGGTSGAGKSELIMSMVAGLMALNPPDRVNVLFIDYKGGASTAAFGNAPHTVGCVTNLDTMLAMRALTSLRAELNRRMSLLEGRAKDLGEMMARYPDEAPPSLVIVVDEFATLVKEIPDFVAGVVDLAQRGRSLGIHLLLATQRPAGAVNENILANTNLRISLRMLDAAGSNSVIGTGDAAAIPTPLKGRGFARLGPGELVPFQTAWSGAPVVSDRGPTPVTVRPFDTPTSSGSAPSPPPVLGLDDSSDAGSELTQLAGVLAAIDEAAVRSGQRPSPSPWLDELPTVLSLDDLPESAPTSPSRSGSRPALEVAIGMVDDPAAQAQYPAVVDLETNGGPVILGAPGSGKTTALRTLGVAAIREAKAIGAELTLFGLDFASRQLTVLAGLGQCAGMATGDDLEAVTRIIVTLETELARRRDLIGSSGRTGAERPSFEPILLLIDDYGSLAQTFEGAGAATSLYPWLERLNKVIVDGRPLGLYTALTASRRAPVRTALMSAMPTRFILRQTDASAYAEHGLSSSQIGDSELPPGRCFVDGTNLAQLAVVAPQPDMNQQSKSWWDVDQQQHSILTLGPLTPPVGVPSLRTEILPDRVEVLPRPKGSTVLRIGIADLDHRPVDVELVGADMSIVGDPTTGRSTALATIAHQLVETGVDVFTLGPDGSRLASVATTQSCFGGATELSGFLNELAESIGQATPALGRSPRRIMVIDDVDLIEDPGLDRALVRLLEAGVRFVAATSSMRGYSTSPLSQAMRKTRTILCLCPAGSRDVHETTGFPAPIRPGLTMPPGRGVLVANRVPTVVQISDYFAPVSVSAIGGRSQGLTGSGSNPVSSDRVTTNGSVTRCRVPGRSGPAPASG
ncbi:MAG: hypothetical protein GY724_03155 [Actinomycetia bacterium]|nr:hypothetical protein [Actinomycetes bacterium]